MQLHPKIAHLLELKRIALKKKKQTVSAHALLDEAHALKKPSSFLTAVKNTNKLTFTCEYKRSSPSEGQISTTNLEAVIRQYERGGADAISILTEQNHFSGSIADLQKARELTSLPLLRKDFIIDEYEVAEAKVYGASAVLLIVGVTPRMEKMINLCKDLEIDPLVECFSREDIAQATVAGARVIGINNRSFVDLSVDRKRALALKQFIPNNCISVAESGVKNIEDVEEYKKAGFDSVLVGTSLMKSVEREKLLKELVRVGHYNGI